jgi:hypothetical protein
VNVIPALAGRLDGGEELLDAAKQGFCEHLESSS